MKGVHKVSKNEGNRIVLENTSIFLQGLCFRWKNSEIKWTKYKNIFWNIEKKIRETLQPEYGIHLIPEEKIFFANVSWIFMYIPTSFSHIYHNIFRFFALIMTPAIRICVV